MQNDNTHPTAANHNHGAAARIARWLGGFGVLTLALAAMTFGDNDANAQTVNFAGVGGIVDSADSANPADSADSANSAPIVIYDGEGFAAFRQQAQMRLFSKIDAILAAKAETILQNRFALRKAEVQLQTELGGREGQLAFNAVSPFTESASQATGWQVRIYTGTEDSKGVNAGIFHRRISGDTLFGANAFIDYEKHDHGTFSRYSAGAEMRSGYVDLAANYYVPISGDKAVSPGVVAFSRRGYDVAMRAGIAKFKFFKAGLDYYHFEGKNGVKADKGFRYGAHLHPFSGLRVDIFYDDSDESGGEFGGDISFSHTIGGKPKANEGGEGNGFTPDLFAPVSREYSQRVVLATLADSTSGGGGEVRFVRSGAAVFVVGITGVVGTATIPDNGALSVDSSSGLSVAAGTVLHYNPNAPGAITAMLTMTAPAQTITQTFSLTAFNAIAPAAMPITIDIPAAAGTILLQGGGIAGDLPSGVSVAGNIIHLSASVLGAISHTLTITNAMMMTITQTLSVTVVGNAGIPPITSTFTGGSLFMVGRQVTVGRISSEGSNGIYGYQVTGNLNHGFSIETINGNGLLRFSVATSGAHTATVLINDLFPQTPEASVFITISAFAGECSFIDGCPVLNHAARAIPPLSLATMLADAGANINEGRFTAVYRTEVMRIPTVNPTLTVTIHPPRAGILAYYAAIIAQDGETTESVRRFGDLARFFVMRGADINYQSRAGGPGQTGQTALDIVNSLSSSDANPLVLPKSALIQNGARCFLRCRQNDTHINGNICTRNSHSGEPCRP